MRHPWRRICSLFHWRPRVWEDIKYRQFSWSLIHESYDQMVQDEKRLKSLLSKGACDESTMKIASDIHVDITNSWYGVKIYESSLKETKRESLRMTPQELMICNGYRTAAYRIFYECRELFLDAKVRTGRLSQAKMDEFMDYARKQVYA